MSNANQIVEYGITDAALQELKSKFSLVPDSSTDKGYADIKSALKIISPYRTGIEAKRKELKAESLARGRLIDAEAKRITTAILEIESPFKLEKQKRDDELKAIEQAKLDAEAEHIAAIEKKVSGINDLVDGLLGADLKTLQARLKAANETIINNVEFEDQIETAKESMLNVKDTLEKAIAERGVFEKQQAEYEAQQKLMIEQQAELDAKQAELDKQEAVRKEKEREDQIASEAEERASKAAELAAQKERLEAENRERELKEAAELAERKAKETEQRIKDEQEAEAKRLSDEAEAREKDKKHRASINNAAVNALVEGGMNETNAKKAIVLIAKKLIPGVVISY